MRFHDMDGTDWIWMTSMMVIFWGVVAVLVIALIRRSGPTDAAPRDTPEATLRQRLARSEIDVEEYQQRLDALEGSTKK
ncbi:MAG: SHOCT domain-containing protein [Acidimicrobiales bacterium]